MAEGKYPQFLLFALLIQIPQAEKERPYAKHYNSAQNAVETLFGVFFQQVNMLAFPCRLAHVNDDVIVLKACCILSNMIAD